jgi:hypothetical protein
MAGTDSGEVMVQMPGSAVMVSFASQRERDRSLRLAQARQELAERQARAARLDGWTELTGTEREDGQLTVRPFRGLRKPPQPAATPSPARPGRGGQQA